MRRAIAIDVQDGVPHVVFNGWLLGSHADSGRSSGLHNAEILAAWRDADDPVDAENNMLLPDGTWVNVRRHGWEIQGFERMFLPAEIPPADGLYRLMFLFLGDSRSADVVYEMQFLDTSFRVEDHLPGNTWRTIGVDVVGGKAHMVFNGWLDADEDGAGALTGRRPLEVIGAWRDASDEMDTNVNVLLPNGTWVDVKRGDWARQGFECIGLPPEFPINDGTYRFHFEAFGANRLATVDYRAALGDWTFYYTGPVAGETAHVIDVEVTGGVAREIANTWR